MNFLLSIKISCFFCFSGMWKFPDLPLHERRIYPISHVFAILLFLSLLQLLEKWIHVWSQLVWTMKFPSDFHNYTRLNRSIRSSNLPMPQFEALRENQKLGSVFENVGRVFEKLSWVFKKLDCVFLLQHSPCCSNQPQYWKLYVKKSTCKFMKKALSHILFHVFCPHFLTMYITIYFFRWGFESVWAQSLSVKSSFTCNSPVQSGFI